MLRHFLSWLFRGPQCSACDERELTDKRATLKGWRWGSFHPDPEVSVCWLCRDCLMEDRE
jgi:hypothetical protein